jgi:hypothetical protein
MTESSQNRKKILKELIKQLHSGVQPQEIKERFKNVLEGVTPLEISRIEQELIQEGMPREEIRRLCEVHLTVFREQLEKQSSKTFPEHPIHILMEEHKIMLQLSEKLTNVANRIQTVNNLNFAHNDLEKLKHIAKDFQDSEKHYLREENVLFPYLEKHGITEPPTIMWMEHNQIREKKKQLHSLVENYNNISFVDFQKQINEIAAFLNNMLSNHFFKENKILFPAAQRVIDNDEWKEIRHEFDEIGYCCFTPPQLIASPSQTKMVQKIKPQAILPKKNVLQFETGALSKDEIEAVLNTLPIDITFVDKNDMVKYFNKAEERIFVRTKAVIGRKVQLCHPQKSLHIVNKILNAFKTGEKDAAEFWIQKDNRLIHIRYFAVRDKHGKYIGTLEVTQDITELKKIEGERRLLDWGK